MASISQRKAAAKKRLQAAEKAVASLRKEVGELDAEYSGDRPSPEQARLIKTQRFSFTVHFERRKVLRKVRSPGAVCKSLRRFTSQKEAVHHGKRFTRKHSHKGFEVIRVNQRANAWINWRTGKTNPVLNK